MIWVAPTLQPPASGNSGLPAEVGTANLPVSKQQREAVSRAANAVRILAALSMLIFPASIQDVCKVCQASAFWVQGSARGLQGIGVWTAHIRRLETCAICRKGCTDVAEMVFLVVVCRLAPTPECRPATCLNHSSCQRTLRLRRINVCMKQ